MAAPRTQIIVRRYVSGWCETALHSRCKGSYADTACCCSCHQRAVQGAGTAGPAAASRGSGNDGRAGS